MSDKNNNFLEFSKPFIDALKETFEVMIGTSISVHSPKLKESNTALEEITSLIGMNGVLTRGKEEGRDFKGQLSFSFSKEVYCKIASAMLMEEYTDYCDDIADAGSEIANIVMGNAKKILIPLGYGIQMATPSTIVGKGVKIKYPTQTVTIVTTIDCDFGSFFCEICYQDNLK
ncbi:MAG: chemotaxis protein CheX [Bacteriovoracaceae bacterium]|jgi:chemotaxis protein CheX|nr:chemotaxis protein CheX [Bacteriovoracaceae bacterium]